MTKINYGLIAAALWVAGFALHSGPAFALDKVRIGKSATASITFSGMDLGKENGIWASVGIDPEVITFGGDGKLQEAFAAKQLDFGIGSGPSLAFHVKGVPATGVAEVAGPPKVFAISVAYDGPYKTVDDLKGKMIGVTTLGSLNDYLVRHLAVEKGWGPDGFQVIPMGTPRTRLAAMKTNQLQGNTVSINEGFDEQDQHATRMIANLGDSLPNFITHVLFANDDLIAKNPDLVRRFVKGWFEIVAYMKTHKDEGVKNAAKVMGESEESTAQAYDTEMSMLSDDGAFLPAGLEGVRNSLKDLGFLDYTPEAKDLYNGTFVPVKN